MVGPGSRVRLLAPTALFVLTFFCRAEAQQPHAATTDSTGPDFRAQVEKDTFLLVNQYRKENDLPALTWNDAIAKEARGHSKDMATGDVDFGHDGFSDRVGHLKGELEGSVSGAGENVLFTSNLNEVAHTAVTLWLHSPHHLKNIRGDYNYSGVGVWQDKNGVIYFTQLFVQLKPTAAAETSAQPGIISSFGLLTTPTVSKTR